MSRRKLDKAPHGLRLLLLEHDGRDAEVLRRELGRLGTAVTVERVPVESFRDTLPRFAPDAILANADADAIDPALVLATVQAVWPTAGLMLVGEGFETERAIAMLRAGAEHVITRGRWDDLRAAIVVAVRIREPLRRLSPRQLAVLRLMVRGHPTREIARRLMVSVKTIEAHRAEVMKRLGIRDVAGLVRYAVRVGLIELEP